MLTRGLRFNGDLYVPINSGVDVFSGLDYKGLVGKRQRHVVNRLGYGLNQRALSSYLQLSEFGDLDCLSGCFSVIASGDVEKIDEVVRGLKGCRNYRFDGIGFRVEQESVSDFVLFDNWLDNTKIRLGLISQEVFEKHSNEVGLENINI